MPDHTTNMSYVTSLDQPIYTVTLVACKRESNEVISLIASRIGHDKDALIEQVLTYSVAPSLLYHWTGYSLRVLVGSINEEASTKRNYSLKSMPYISAPSDDPDAAPSDYGENWITSLE